MRNGELTESGSTGSRAEPGDASLSSDDAWLRAIAAAPPKTPPSARTKPRLLPTATVVADAFRIDGVLGRGAMGVVYLATDLALDRRVALKLHASPDDDANASRMWREAKAMARLSHPNVVTVHEIGLYERRVYIAMELVGGGTLHDWLQPPRSWREVVRVFIQAAQGLAAAHRVGLVHRDFKPRNVLVDRDGRVRVADFGLARIAEAEEPAQSTRPGSDRAHDEAETRTGVAIGTPAYMAPEQVAGGTVDDRSDQFAFCVALHEALYGVRPFEGDTVAELHTAAAEGRVRPAVAGRGVPGWLRAVVLRGLQPRAADRFDGMNAVVAALRADPSRHRSKKIVAFGSAAAALLLASGLAFAEHRRTAHCEQDALAIDETWNANARATLHDAMIGTGAPLADDAFERTAPILDAYAQAWREQYTRLCTATEVEHRRAPELWAASRQCLHDARGELAAWLDAISRHAPARIVDDAAARARELAPVKTCADDAWLARHPARPGGDEEHRALLWRAKAMTDVGEYDAGLAMTDAILAEVGDDEIRAATLAQAGILAQHARRYHDAATSLGRAFDAAMRIGDDDTAVTAAVRLVGLLGETQPDEAEALWWARIAAGLLQRIGALGSRRDAALHAELGALHQRMGRLADAARDYRYALSIWKRELGGDHPEVVRVRKVLGDLAPARDRDGDGPRPATR